jgi:energy-coupling factor transporter ATP-binding protein EcfA2
MTAPATLKSITLTAFRGSAGTFKLDFEKSRKLTLIYGENGTGKTTICDAFEFLAFGRIGSLEDRGMGKGLEKFWPTACKTLRYYSSPSEKIDYCATFSYQIL